MLSDEERQTIEYLKARLYGNEGCKIIDVAQSDLRIFLKLVENLQKDITLKNNKICDLKSQIDEHVYNGCDYELCNKKWKTKIKAKIEELEKMDIYEFETMNTIEVLQSLLEKE